MFYKHLLFFVGLDLFYLGQILEHLNKIYKAGHGHFQNLFST